MVVKGVVRSGALPSAGSSTSRCHRSLDVSAVRLFITADYSHLTAASPPLLRPDAHDEHAHLRVHQEAGRAVANRHAPACGGAGEGLRRQHAELLGPADK